MNVMKLYVIPERQPIQIFTILGTRVRKIN